jgi:4-diphosphocytidyl-2C-methyl-D-erythritol kinase
MPAPLTSVLTADGSFVITADEAYVVYAGEIIMPVVGLVKSKATLYVTQVQSHTYTFQYDTKVAPSSSSSTNSIAHSSKFDLLQSGNYTTITPVACEAKVILTSASVSLSF